MFILRYLKRIQSVNGSKSGNVGCKERPLAKKSRKYSRKTAYRGVKKAENRAEIYWTLLVAFIMFIAAALKVSYPKASLFASYLEESSTSEPFPPEPKY